jgi:hypothetical protein
MVTCAPGRTPPVSSVTSPDRVAVVVCAGPSRENVTAKTAEQMNNPNPLNIEDPPLRKRGLVTLLSFG